MKNNNFEQVIIKLIIGAGVLVSTIQFFYNRSLWLDEAYLSLNIINKSHFDLLKPLDLWQVAPILFLQIEKVFSNLIPNSEFGLRLFPLISFWLSIFLFYKIIKTINQNYYTIIFSLSLFVFNSTFIYYSSEAKQYMSDVLVLTSVYYLILRKYKNQEYKYYYLGFFGAISIFLSNVAPIILFTAGFYLLHEYYRNEKKYFLNLIGISIVWGSSFLLYYYLFIHNHPTRDLMIKVWSNENVFMLTNPLNLKFYKFLWGQWIGVVTDLLKFHKIGGVSLSVLIVIGSVSLIRKRRIDFIILTMTPIILHLLLSSFKLYPFDSRFILYLCPIIILICSFGFFCFVDMLFANLKIERFRLLAISIPLLMFSFFYINGFPLKKSEIKKSIKFVEQQIDKKDLIYVNFFASIPFRYYREISLIKMDTKNIVIGKLYDKNYSNEVSLLNGRVWFIFATNIEYERENMKFLTNYFALKGEKLIQEFHTNGSTVYLYDLNPEIKSKMKAK